MTEVWIDIKGYENQYQISSFGNVRRLDHSVIIPEYERMMGNSVRKHSKSIRHFHAKEMKKGQDKDGYFLVTLKRKTFRVGHMVANHFIDNPYHYTSISYKDGDVQNNYVENLQWTIPPTEEEKYQTKLKYEAKYRKCPKRISWGKKNRESGLRYKQYTTSLQRRYSIGKKEAIKKGREWSISLDFYKSFITNCYYCNKDLSDSTGYCLDRIDNDKGYFKENVLPCCGICNKIRGDRLSMEEMEVAMKAVLEYRAACKYGNYDKLIKKER